jgi:hypothetical protein
VLAAKAAGALLRKRAVAIIILSRVPMVTSESEMLILERMK